MIQNAIDYALDPHSGVLNQVLALFNGIFKTGGQAVADAGGAAAAALFTFRILVGLAAMGITRSGVFNGILVILGGSIWYECVSNCVPLAQGYMDWMGSLGAQVAGGAGNGAVMSNPSGIFATGLKGGGALLREIGKLSGIGLSAFGGILLLVAGFTALIITFAIMGAIAVLVMVQAYLQVLVGITLLPLAIEPSTRGFAAPGISMIISAGASLGTCSLILGAGHRLLSASALPPAKGLLRYAINQSLGAIVIALLSGVLLFFTARGVVSLLSSAKAT
jgi:hypothetical protein